MTMSEQTLANDLMALRYALLQLTGEEDAIFWIYTGSKSSSIKIKDPDRRKIVQDKIDHHINGLMIVHIFAVIDEYCAIKKWYKYLTTDEKLRIRAFQHIRHSNAHKFKANRAHSYTSEFNTIMKSATPIINIKSYDKDTIILNNGTCMELFNWLSNLVQDVIARVLNP